MKKPPVIVALAIILLLLNLHIACNKKYASSNSPWDSSNTDVDSISFIVVGDWGKDGAESQKSVADAMNDYSKKFHAAFFVTTGDNFYPAGVSSTSDPHWQLSYENIYNKDGQQVPWYPVLGNHDYQQNPAAEVQYSSLSNRWTMPARYYTIKKNINQQTTAFLVFTDTSPFVSAYYGASMADLPQQDTAAQLRWLGQALSSSNDRWKLVFGHHPVYSVGPHAQTPELIQRFKPIFEQTHTDFYICGHDHSLQHIEWPLDPVHYLVSGGGSESTSVSPQSYTPFARSTPGFLVVTLYSSRANFYFVNQRGEMVYRNQVLK
jgi:tartrate-resistant acid phosphatase type 5